MSARQIPEKIKNNRKMTETIFSCRICMVREQGIAFIDRGVSGDDEFIALRVSGILFPKGGPVLNSHSQAAPKTCKTSAVV